MKKSFKSNSPEETLQIAREFSRDRKGGEVIALSGELGSGKTCFAKGFISERTGIGVDEITSPTFTLIEEFPGEPKIYHVDLYRLEKREELEELPWEDLFSPHSLSIIEWPEKAQDLVIRYHYEINFTKQGSKQREIVIEAKDVP